MNMIQDNDTTIIQDRFNEMESYVKEQALEEQFYAMMLIGHVTAVETEHLADKLSEMTKKENTFSPILERHLGRPVYNLDCAKLCKGDAKRWLDNIAKIPISPKPIFVIENITELPEGDIIHDDAQYVRNLLLHNWKNTPNNCSVFITWAPENRAKMNHIWNRADGYAWFGNLEEKYQEFLDTYKDCSWQELEQKLGIKL